MCMSQFRPDFLSSGKTAVFSISRIQSTPTLNHIKHIEKFIPQLDVDRVICISFDENKIFDFLMPKLSSKIIFVQDKELAEKFKLLLNKRGNVSFLKDYWHFACILDDGSVTAYIEQPFENKLLCPDPKENFYKNVSPGQLLQAKIQS